jgi:hypothetical protein
MKPQQLQGLYFGRSADTAVLLVVLVLVMLVLLVMLVVLVVGD